MFLAHPWEARPGFETGVSLEQGLGLTDGSRGCQALLPSARYERRVGVGLVRAAWERRPEGPAYLPPCVMLLYLAGQCAFFCTHLPPWIRGTRRVFPEFLWIPDLSPPAVISSERDPTVQEVQSLKKCFSWRY